MNLLFQAAQQARQIRERQELIFWTACDPSTTFDPKITGVAGTWFFDDGTTLEAANGAEISKTFAVEGLHRAVFRPASGGLAAITAIDCNNDLVTTIIGLSRMAENVKIDCYSNASLVLSLNDVRNATQITATGCSLLSGDLSELNRSSISLYLTSCRLLTGCVSDLPPAVLIARLRYDILLTSGSIAPLTAARDLQFQDLTWLTADVDTVINSMWAARANYTYATPSLNIGGNNQAPTGNVVAPVEGADWHQDGATWIPLTAGAKIYDLAKNVNSEARTASWTITYTGGSIAP